MSISVQDIIEAWENHGDGDVDPFFAEWDAKLAAEIDAARIDGRADGIGLYNRLGEPTDHQYATFGRYVAALLGANTEWDSAADYLEDIASAGHRRLGKEIGDQTPDVLSFWREVADSESIEYDEAHDDSYDDDEDDE